MDKYIVPLEDIPKGITPIPSLNVDQPVVKDMVDLRPLGGLLERVGYTTVAAAAVADPFEARVVSQGGTSLVLPQCSSYARLATAHLTTAESATRLFQPDGSDAVQTMMAGDFLGYNGAVVMLDYPCGGAFMIYKPGVIPPETWTSDPGIGSTDWSAAYPKGGMLLTLDNADSVYGVQPHMSNLIVFGDTKVAMFGFGDQFGQSVFSSPGTLSKWAWCGDFGRAFFIGQDKNLWIVEQGVPKPVGFSWLWSEYTRAWMTYVPETGDVFILLDKGTNETSYVSPVCYLYNKGLTRLSQNVVTAQYLDDEIEFVNTDGDFMTMTKPLREDGDEWDWDDTEYDETWFDRDYDILTEWSDFGAASLKDLSGLEVKSLPFQPIYTKVYAFAAADTAPSEDENWIKAPAPVAEHEKQGNRFQLEYRVPTYVEAGSAKYTAFRAHLKGADLWGLYGVTLTQAASG